MRLTFLILCAALVGCKSLDMGSVDEHKIATVTSNQPDRTMFTTDFNILKPLKFKAVELVNDARKITSKTLFHLEDGKLADMESLLPAGNYRITIMTPYQKHDNAKKTLLRFQFKTKTDKEIELERDAEYVGTMNAR